MRGPRPRRRDLGDDLALRRALVAGIGLLRLLDQQDAAALRVEGGADEIPFPGEQRPAGRISAWPPALILEDQRQAAAGVEAGRSRRARPAIDEICEPLAGVVGQIMAASENPVRPCRAAQSGTTA